MDSNEVFIGTKEVMKYVQAVIVKYNNGAKTITIKARGRSISKAVDVAVVVRNKFLSNMDVKNIRIGTQQMETGIRLSTIEIELSLKKA